MSCGNRPKRVLTYHTDQSYQQVVQTRTSLLNLHTQRLDIKLEKYPWYAFPMFDISRVVSDGVLKLRRERRCKVN